VKVIKLLQLCSLPRYTSPINDYVNICTCHRSVS